MFLSIFLGKKKKTFCFGALLELNNIFKRHLIRKRNLFFFFFLHNYTSYIESETTINQTTNGEHISGTRQCMEAQYW